MRIAKIIANNLHFGMTVLLLLCIAPSLRAAGLPLQFDWAQLCYLFGPTGLMFLSLVSIAILELAERTREEPGGFTRALSSIALPGV